MRSSFAALSVRCQPKRRVQNERCLRALTLRARVPIYTHIPTSSVLAHIFSLRVRPASFYLHSVLEAQYCVCASIDESRSVHPDMKIRPYFSLVFVGACAFVMTGLF